MGCGLCFLQGSRSWLARLVPVLAVLLSFSISHELLSVPIFILILLLFISILSLLFKSWTKTIVDHLQVEESHGTDENDVGSSSQEYMSHAGEAKEDEEESKTLTVQEEANNESNQGFFIRSSSSADLYYLGRESMDRLSSGEDHDVRERPIDCSDDSISDEESLIEIAITCGESVGTLPKKDSNLMNLKNCCKREEFLADVYEMNEEDNLIEIDIYMGSIKCSSFGNLDIRRKKLL